MAKNKTLEKQLRSEFSNYQAKAHPEDRMTFIEYVSSLGTFKGHRMQFRQSINFGLIIDFKKS